MEQTLSLSTHILDISKGQTAAGVVIKLYKYENELWFESSEYAITDQDGRFRNFRGVNEKVCGIYKLKFEVGEYFTRMGTESLYPFIEVKKLNLLTELINTF